MKTRPKIVTLCGSTRFKAAFIEANYRETMAGRMVFSVGWFSHADAEVYAPTEEEKARLDELHLAKIDASDEVLVLNCLAQICPNCRTVWHRSPKPGMTLTVTICGCGADLNTVLPVGYVGDSTRREIAHAEAAGKVVRYLNPPN